MDEKELLKHAERYGFGKIYEDRSEPDLYRYQYFVDARGCERWAVTQGDSICYDSEIKGFILEPSPSNRTDKFLKTTRFSLEDAIEIAQDFSKFCYDYCAFLNIKEYEQNRLPDKPDHICLKYNQKIVHGPFHPKLIRCEECRK